MRLLGSIKKEAVSPQHLGLLYELYKEAEYQAMPTRVNYLLKYQNIDTKVVPKVLRILLKRSKEDSRFVYIYSGIFRSHNDINQSIIELFRNDWQVLKDAYFSATDVKRYVDYDSKTLTKIIKHDPDFIFEYIDKQFEKEENFSPHDEDAYFGFLWLKEGFKKIAGQISRHVFDLEKEKPSISGTYFRNIFSIREGNNDMDKIRDNQDAFLKHEIEENYDEAEYMQFIFTVICNFSAERRKPFIALFLEHNKSFDDFKYLPLEPSQWGWTGSAVPMYQSRRDFYSSLLSLLNTIEFVKHREFITQKIEGLKKTIKTEQKRDFLRDY